VRQVSALRSDIPVRFALVGSLLGAAVIHAAQGREHFEEWWAAGWFFVFITLAEAGTALWSVRSRNRRVNLIALWLSGLALLVWGVSRSIGLPFGPERWLPERVGRPDFAAGTLELITIAAALLLLKGRATRQHPAIGSFAVLTTAVLVGIAFTAPEECGSHADEWPFGPLVPVDGHAMVYRDTPPTKAESGDRVAVVIGYLKNCGARTLRIDDIDVSAFGDGGAVGPVKIVSASRIRDHNSVSLKTFATARDAVDATVPPTRDDPSLVLVAEIDTGGLDRAEGSLGVGAVIVSYKTGWRTFRAPFGSAAQVVVGSA
jgi:hypothetical protein